MDFPKGSKLKAINSSIWFLKMKNSCFQMIPKWRPVSVCCKGFDRSSNGTHCVPSCSQTCVHGECVEPDVCDCEPGYGGISCSKCKFLKL